MYANIYCRKHPERSAEILQYIANIRTVAGFYVWDNGYSYDVNFRHVVQKKPWCNWAKNCQTGWSLEMKDKLEKQNFNFNSKCRNGQRGKVKDSTFCWKFN